MQQASQPPNRELPDLRRRQRLRAQQPVPALLQRALQEHGPGRLGQRALSHADARTPPDDAVFGDAKRDDS